MSEDKPQILLIDDEAIALSNLSHVLEREGYVVTACRDGESGLAAMQSTRFATEQERRATRRRRSPRSLRRRAPFPRSVRED